MANDGVKKSKTEACALCQKHPHAPLGEPGRAGRIWAHRMESTTWQHLTIDVQETKTIVAKAGQRAINGRDGMQSFNKGTELSHETRTEWLVCVDCFKRVIEPLFVNLGLQRVVHQRTYNHDA